MDAENDAADEVTRCGRCGRRWSQSHETCPLDGMRLTREDVHDQATVLLSRSMIAAVRASAPRDDTTTDVSTLDDARDVGGTTAMILSAAGRVSSGEVTAQTARDVESEPPPTTQPASDPTTATRLDPGFVHLVSGTLVGEYVVEKLLGSGGMGAVYGACHEKLGRPTLPRSSDSSRRRSRSRGCLTRTSSTS